MRSQCKMNDKDRPKPPIEIEEDDGGPTPIITQ